jgi:hypothetical protein
MEAWRRWMLSNRRFDLLAQHALLSDAALWDSGAWNPSLSPLPSREGDLKT